MDSERDLLSALSPSDFRSVGTGQLAYIRPVYKGDAEMFSLHAADGTQLSLMASYADAIAGARVNNLFPLTVH